MPQCPCGTLIEYERCCGCYISHNALPKTPEQLMRSRYTAFTQSNIRYIRETMTGPALQNFNGKELKMWSESVQWLGLEVLAAPQVALNSRQGFVHFIAHFKIDGQKQHIEENSQFIHNGKQWLYVGALNEKSSIDKDLNFSVVNKNAPCPCGSGKKYKRCCAS